MRIDIFIIESLFLFCTFRMPKSKQPSFPIHNSRAICMQLIFIFNPLSLQCPKLNRHNSQFYILILSSRWQPLLEAFHSNSLQKQMSPIPNSRLSFYLYADSLHSRFAALMEPTLRPFLIHHFHDVHIRQSSFSILYFHDACAQETSILNSTFSRCLHAGNVYYEFTIIVMSVLREPLFVIHNSQAIFMQEVSILNSLFSLRMQVESLYLN